MHYIFNDLVVIHVVHPTVPATSYKWVYSRFCICISQSSEYNGYFICFPLFRPNHVSGGSGFCAHTRHTCCLLPFCTLELYYISTSVQDIEYHKVHVVQEFSFFIIISTPPADLPSYVCPQPLHLIHLYIWGYYVLMVYKDSLMQKWNEDDIKFYNYHYIELHFIFETIKAIFGLKNKKRNWKRRKIRDKIQPDQPRGDAKLTGWNKRHNQSFLFPQNIFFVCMLKQSSLSVAYCRGGRGLKWYICWTLITINFKRFKSKLNFNFGFWCFRFRSMKWKGEEAK